MKIVWEWSLESEAKRITEMSMKVANGFYHLHHFLPLPYKQNEHRPNSSHYVYLPNYSYSSIPRYWESVAKLGECYPLKQIDFVNQALIPHLYSLNLIPPINSKLQSSVETYLPKVINWLKNTFPDLTLPEKILIHPSYFGTGGSFFFIKSEKTVELFLRTDQELHSLVEILITAVLRPHSGDTLYTDWEKSEYLVDYLLLESSLKDLLPPSVTWTPTTIPPHYPQEVLQESQDFLIKIGAPINAQTRFMIKGEVIYFNDTQLSNLNAKESVILKALISRAPAPLSNDEIGDLIFISEEKFSLSAISKTIERLRKKLTSLGISSSYIATASGVGYYLKL